MHPVYKTTILTVPSICIFESNLYVVKNNWKENVIQSPSLYLTHQIQYNVKYKKTPYNDGNEPYNRLPKEIKAI